MVMYKYTYKYLYQDIANCRLKRNVLVAEFQPCTASTLIFRFVQLAVAMGIFWVGLKAKKRSAQKSPMQTRSWICWRSGLGVGNKGGEGMRGVVFDVEKVECEGMGSGTIS